MKIVLIFTRSVSLERWIRKGLFDREKLLYESLIKEDKSLEVYWITYGKDDSILASELYKKNSLSKKITVLPKPSFFPEGKFFDFLYSFLIPFFHSFSFASSTLIKSNQIDGSWSGLLASWIYRKPFILRLGYLPSQVENAAVPKNIVRFNILFLMEKLIAFLSQNIISSTPLILQLVQSLNFIGSKNYSIIPNYVNTELFHSFRELNSREEKIIYFGRLSREKNLFHLIDACHLANIQLDIFGDGPLLHSLRTHVKELGYNVLFFPPVQNSELPCLLNKYKYSALVSTTEGMPKSLIESMSCGVIPIVSPIEPITSILGEDYQFVSGSHSSKSISSAIIKAMACKTQALSDKLSQSVFTRYSISSITKKEIEFYHTVLNKI